MFLKISQSSQENTCARVSFLIKLQASACNFIKKEALAQVLSCEFCEIFKSTFFYRTPPVGSSTHVFYRQEIDRCVLLTGKHLAVKYSFCLSTRNSTERKTALQVFSCKFYQTFQNMFFHRTSPNNCFCNQRIG